MSDIQKKLQAIQSELEVPKSQYNAFGKYNYRNAEDILAAAKPLCIKNKCLLTVTDEMAMFGDRFYVKATARLVDEEAHIETTAYAREELTKKGMDAAQITGAASSYARKYALNGLFCLDDVKDADHNNRPQIDPDVEITPEDVPALHDEAEKLFDNKPDTKPVKYASEKQQILIKNKYEELGISDELLETVLMEDFQVKTPAELTMKEASTLIDKLLKQASGKK